MEPIFFTSPEEFGDWLAEHHATESEVLVGQWKKATGKPTLTWQEAVREALRFGWIDGRGTRIDDERHQLRFTPRRQRSTWSRVNIRNVEELIAAGRMEPAGLAAFEARTEDNSEIYSFERAEDAVLTPEDEARFRADAAAWSYWEARPPGYRRTALHWVVTAKREATRESRLTTLIAACAAGEPIPLLRPRRKT